MSLLDPLRFFQRSHAARVNDRAGTGDREDECSRGNLVFTVSAHSRTASLFAR